MILPRRILVVDRDEAARRAIHATLSAEGYFVTTVADSEAALAAAEAHPPDMLVTELAEAARGDFRLVRALRRLEDASQMPVLVLSAAGQPTSEELASAPLSPLSFLARPVDGPALAERVALLLRTATQADERPILVVDDDRSNLELIERRLEVEDFRTELVETGQQAIEAALARGFQAVLLDLRLPDMTGLDVLARMREHLPDLPVLIMTAHGSEALAVKALTAGADDYLIKPLSRRELLAALRNAIERRRLQVENRRMQHSLAETVLALQESLRATERSRKRLETLMETLDAGVVLLDAEQRIERINGAARRMLRAGDEASDLEGLLAGVQSATAEDGEPIDLADRVMNEDTADTEVVVRWPDGSESALLLAAKPVPSGDQHAESRLVVFRDVTGRHHRRGKLEVLLEQMAGQVETVDARRVAEVEQATAEAERVKNQILSAVSHELRTPLNFIVGFGSVLADGLAGDLTPEQFRLVEKMLAGAERLTATVDDLLNYAMLTTGMLQAAPEPLALADVVSEVTGFLRPEGEDKGVNLIVALEEAPAVVRGDPVFVRHILRHLIANAIKFTAPEGAVTVRAGGGEDEAWVEVADTGIGIAPERLPRLFDRFYQVESAPTRRFGGTGMGLALARGLAELMDARIQVESVPGQGSRFRLIFPELACAEGDGHGL